MVLQSALRKLMRLAHNAVGVKVGRNPAIGHCPDGGNGAGFSRGPEILCCRHVHRIGAKMPEQRGFHIAAMDAKTALLRRVKAGRRARGTPTLSDGQHPGLNPQFARED